MTCSSQYLAGPSSRLDRYVWIYGMVCAFFHPKYEAGAYTRPLFGSM